MSEHLRTLVLERQVVICCGAGGVGKTTTATALALAAARAGRRVLALTIDPSKRLAETLGVERNLKAPVSLPPERLREAGIEAPGALETWMLDPQLISERTIRRLSKDEESFERLRQNRIYQQISRMVAGMQEYTAMEALHTFLKQERYDLIILDTPPSRHALDFLDGPRRLERFFDGRIFQLFQPGDTGGFIMRAASRLIGQVLSSVFGEESYEELQEFFGSFAAIFSVLTVNAGEMFGQLSDAQRSAFVLVTSPTSESVTDALHFRQKTAEMELPFAGFVLNRSQAAKDARVFPETALLGPHPDPNALSALAKLQNLAKLEVAEVDRDRELLAELNETAGELSFATPLPNMPLGANNMRALVQLADFIVS